MNLSNSNLSYNLIIITIFVCERGKNTKPRGAIYHNDFDTDLISR